MFTILDSGPRKFIRTKGIELGWQYDKENIKHIGINQLRRT